MLKLKLQYFGHLMGKAESLEKILILGKKESREQKGTTEEEMFRWRHRFNGHKFEETPRDGDGQGRLACCSPRGHKDSDTNERLNATTMASQRI